MMKSHGWLVAMAAMSGMMHPPVALASEPQPERTATRRAHCECGGWCRGRFLA